MPVYRYVNVCLEPEEAEGVVSPGPGVMDGYEPPCGCWKSNPGPLQEQPVVLLAGPISSSSPPPLTQNGVNINKINTCLFSANGDS